MSVENIEEAVLVAIASFERLYGNKGFSDVLMEEVRSVEGDEWEVTIGYNRQLPTSTAQMLTQGAQVVREYKVFTVDRATEQVESVRIREA